MKSLIIIIVLVLAGIAGYNFINKPTSDVESLAVVEDATPSEKNEVASSTVEDVSEQIDAPGLEDVEITSSTDKAEAPKHEVSLLMKDYDKCMLEDKPEYHQENLKAEDMVGQTISECEPILVDMKEALDANDVNDALGKNIIQNLRLRLTDQLMVVVLAAQEAGRATN